MQIAEDIKTKRLVRTSFESCRTVAIFGKRGTGKSYTLGRMLEQAYFAQRHTIVVIDPLSVFWQTAIAESSRAIAVKRFDDRLA